MSAQHFVNATVKATQAQNSWPFATMTALGAEIEQEWLTEDALDTGALAQAENIRICHSFAPSLPGGVTIAYRKVTPFVNCRMVEVAVAYCSPHDTFSKKVGARRALDNFLDGATVLVPARTDGDHSIVWNLREMFTI